MSGPSELRPEYRQALVELLYQLADDDLTMGHRDSEWLGLAPHIEEDVAFASIAQDEVGHAAIYYRLLEELGEGKADDLAHLRPAGARRNAVLLERPNGTGTYLVEPHFDWAFAVVRHYLYDLFDAVRLEALVQSSYAPLAQVAAKIRREERYHLLHHETWLRRLARGGEEAGRRLEAALRQAWAEAGGLFDLGPQAEAIRAEGLLPATGEELLARWTARAQAAFAAAGLAWPGALPPAPLNGRAGQHSEDLPALLETLSEVYRLEPAAQW